ncbi:MAG TPA: hypothetical protein DEB39_11830 [Planctomycetaceae bacterium]|nr:hypothetical protein [Planctomycetaceae bacterium]
MIDRDTLAGKRPSGDRYEPPQWRDRPKHPGHLDYSDRPDFRRPGDHRFDDRSGTGWIPHRSAGPPPGFSANQWNRYRGGNLPWIDYRLGFCRGFHGYDRYWTPNWYGRHPYAWRPPVPCNWWSAPLWRHTCGWIGIRTVFAGVAPIYQPVHVAPIVYDYGTNVVYRQQTVYVNEEPAGTAAEYYAAALALAGKGASANFGNGAAALNEEWMALGSFAILEDVDMPDANQASVLQIAVNKQGILRGNLYNPVDDSLAPIEGAVDSATQRAAFYVVGEDASVVAECGIWNLTEDTLSMQVHIGPGETNILTLLRLSPQAEQ